MTQRQNGQTFKVGEIVSLRADPAATGAVTKSFQEPLNIATDSSSMGQPPYIMLANCSRARPKTFLLIYYHYWNFRHD
jgi:hypothetical protein